MSESVKAHWEHVYATRSLDGVSWYTPVPARSLELIQATGEPLTAPILDVGGGASTLVDHLLRAGYRDVSVLDIAAGALAHARARLGAQADRVNWIEGDVLRFESARPMAIWHDRAVFHFLTSVEDRERYLRVLASTLRSGGHFLLATFGPEGPTRCSGLPVQRYSEREISALLGPAYMLRADTVEEHRTPAGAAQQFQYGWWQKAA
jgi:SAM-dependent methyltransferase